jgi:hypothetical protein
MTRGGGATGRSRMHVPESWLPGLTIAGCLAACLVASPASAAPSWPPPVNLPGVKKGAESPQVAVDSQGNATAIWRRWSGEKLIVESAVRRVGRGWSVPVNLEVDAGGGYETSQSPQVAVDPEGNATAVWERRLGGRTFVIQSATRSTGGSWSEPVTISNKGRLNYRPRVVVDSEGNATAVWLWSIGESSVIQSATRPAGGSWSAPVDISAMGQAASPFTLRLIPRGARPLSGKRKAKARSRAQPGRPGGAGWHRSTSLQPGRSPMHRRSLWTPKATRRRSGSATTPKAR